jgi:putative ABC transport system permease protein
MLESQTAVIHIADNVSLAVDSIRAHKLRAALTVLGLIMGVATLITVMTLVQGANVYVEQKIANLGTNVFRIGRLPFAVTDFSLLTKAQRYKFLYPDDLDALAANCAHCQAVGAALNSTARCAIRTTNSMMPPCTVTRPAWRESIPEPYNSGATSPMQRTATQRMSA